MTSFYPDDAPGPTGRHSCTEGAGLQLPTERTYRGPHGRGVQRERERKKDDDDDGYDDSDDDDDDDDDPTVPY